MPMGTSVTAAPPDPCVSTANFTSIEMFFITRGGEPFDALSTPTFARLIACATASFNSSTAAIDSFSLVFGGTISSSTVEAASAVYRVPNEKTRSWTCPPTDRDATVWSLIVTDFNAGNPDTLFVCASFRASRTASTTASSLAPSAPPPAGADVPAHPASPTQSANTESPARQANLAIKCFQYTGRGPWLDFDHDFAGGGAAGESAVGIGEVREVEPGGEGPVNAAGLPEVQETL